MDTTVIVALIGAAGVILAAVIPILLLQRRFAGQSKSHVPVLRPERRLAPSGNSDIEQALRRDSRVQRLLGNRNWHDAAEAAIAYYCRGITCPIESWQRSSTWQQVGTVYKELE